MPSNEISQLIDDVVREDLSNRLKSLGYRKTGRTFFAKSESRTAVVNIQANKYNLKDKGTFTINLGV